MTKHYRRERGAVTIIEAAFVFPIMFFIVFFMVMAGETYYQYARAEREVTTAAINGAARCENPMLGSVIASGSVTKDPTAVNVIPYRYILTGEAKIIANEVENELKRTISKYKPLLFTNMSPRNVNISVDLHMNVLVSSFPITCSFSVPFPIRMIFGGQVMRFQYTIHTNAPISDPSEFVRNVALIWDVMERNEAGQTILEYGGKVKNAMSKITNITN